MDGLRSGGKGATAMNNDEKHQSHLLLPERSHKDRLAHKKRRYHENPSKLRASRAEASRIAHHKKRKARSSTKGAFLIAFPLVLSWFSICFFFVKEDWFLIFLIGASPATVVIYLIAPFFNRRVRNKSSCSSSNHLSDNDHIGFEVDVKKVEEEDAQY